ncbi:MAG: hypothetical protein ACFCU3_12035 [Verrucomicrobiales bacterium]
MDSYQQLARLLRQTASEIAAAESDQPELRQLSKKLEKSCQQVRALLANDPRDSVPNLAELQALLASPLARASSKESDFTSWAKRDCGLGLQSKTPAAQLKEFLRAAQEHGEASAYLNAWQVRLRAQGVQAPTDRNALLDLVKLPEQDIAAALKAHYPGVANLRKLAVVAGLKADGISRPLLQQRLLTHLQQLKKNLRL